MTTNRDLERLLDAWFADGPNEVADRVIDDVADRIERQPQRPAWRLRWRTPMNATYKLVAAAAALVIVAVVGYNLLPRQGGVGGQATPPPTAAPTAAPITAPPSSPTPIRDGPLSEGRYQMEALGLSIVADVPAGWIGNVSPYLASTDGFDVGNVLITFMLVDGLFSDACHWDLNGSGVAAQPGDVEVGPTVDDLVQALRANTSYTSSTPSPVTFGPYLGQTLELQLPGDDVISTCDSEAEDRPDGHSYFVFPGAGIYAQGPNNRWQLDIIDVGGTRLVVLLSYFDVSPQSDIAAAKAIVESFEFTP